ncbi:hypothetical protein B1992_02410 [Pseudoxanthomonas broegbernensis]|uniref:Poly(3-hydroxyalkanoate) polymerase subunit PhaE n=1 Tax=Pseudoxanthomonas broegbernensis TaxID=83619 RepID=A0A7V8GP72_9GAMM|nr:class III poly(R)-hydroxyalkanoic acid synthase subunit PhaE [Pseudoxanthomonas broegbernensis]KAF1687538.1 hypothetical protein B1992_02410 [Pseudoxanthomonas broegbernensis]MBB6064547.1 class III poly(R)-hydroxyalkanoic acid synthase PhaE subunit [Pseudoxanthomonas broegbernensis]
MANAPFSPFQGEFESLARQYWNTWNELLGRGAAPQDGWSLLAGGLPPGLGRMDPGAFDWFSRIQQLAARFGGGTGSAGAANASAADIARAWREMLGGEGANPFARTLHAMPGGLAGGAWLEQMRPLLDLLLRPLRQQQAEWLQRPAFGPAREHQERLQALALAWQEWEQRNEAFGALLTRAGQRAFERFERLLEDHDAPGKRLESARALFDLWIDAAEEAWAGIAMSDEYRHAYGEMTNALMRLRLGLQREVEHLGALLGMPGRGEVDALHRKVADLERALHAARRGAAVQPAPARAGATVRAEEEPSAAAPAASQTGSTASGTRRRGAAVRTPVSARGKASAGRAPAAARTPSDSRKAASGTGKPSPGQGKAARPAAARAPVAARTSAQAAAAAKPARAAQAATATSRPGRLAPGKAAKAARRAPAPVVAAAGPAKRSAASAAGKTARPVATSTVAAKKSTHSGSRAPKAAAAKKAASPARRTPGATAARKQASARAGSSRERKAAASGPASSARTGPAKGQANAAAASPPAPAKVVSMKDWVTRNLAAPPPAAAARGGKRGGRGK